jgi:acyl-coenzyme A thioesterase PaaI-like protein
MEMDLLPGYCNRMDHMHGGAAAPVFDICTTLCTAPVVRRDFWWFGGVSTELDVTYLRPVKVGNTIVIECELLQIGRRFATIRGVIKGKADRRTLVVGEHNKTSIEVVGASKIQKGTFRYRIEPEFMLDCWLVKPNLCCWTMKPFSQNRGSLIRVGDLHRWFHLLPAIVGNESMITSESGSESK